MATPRPATQRPAANKTADQRWLHRFLIVLGVLAVVAAGTITYYVSDFSAPPTDAQVPVSVITASGDGRKVECRVNLVVPPDKEEALKARMPMLRAAISEALSNNDISANSGEQMREVPEQLRKAVNDRLPPGLRVREVLIQHLLFGMN